MKESISFHVNGDEVIQFEFLDGKIAICKWDIVPPSTLNWVKPSPGTYMIVGNSLSDVTVVPLAGKKTTNKGEIK